MAVLGMSKDMFFLRLAGLIVKVTCHYNDCRELCLDYITEENKAHMEVEIAQEEIMARKEMTPEYSEENLESLCVHRSIAEQLPAYGRFVFHGASIKFQDKGYIFAAPSGTGKSTHIRAWRKYLGDQVDIVNGDKPILSVGDEGVFVHGTPWAGKEGWQKNQSVKLQGLCFLKRSAENRIRRMEPVECLDMLMKQVYIPQTAEMAGMTLELLNKMLQEVPVYLLECDMSEEAVRCSFEAMTGLEYNLQLGMK